MPCARRLAPLLGLLGLTACGQAETGLLDHQGLTPNGCFDENGEAALHWAPGERCLTVTYDPSLGAYADLIDLGLGAWADLGCSGLCFEAPRPRSLAPDEHPEGSLHLRRSSADDEPQIVQTVLRSRTDSLELVSAEGYLDPARLDELGPDQRLGAITGAIGLMLGLPRGPRGQPSVLTSHLENLPAAPTEGDEATFCKVYGEGGICEL